MLRSFILPYFLKFQFFQSNLTQKERFSRKVVPVSRSENNSSVVRRKEGNGRSVAKATELYTLLRSEKESLAKAKH